jgi:hypothetical protein
LSDVSAPAAAGSEGVAAIEDAGFTGEILTSNPKLQNPNPNVLPTAK